MDMQPKLELDDNFSFCYTSAQNFIDVQDQNNYHAKLGFAFFSTVLMI